MTSNGNTAQKHLIKILTETHQEPTTAYKQAIATAPSKETAEVIKRIYKKLTEATTYQKGDIIQATAPSGHTYTHEVHKDNGDTVTVKEITQTAKTIYYTINKANIIGQ